MPIPLGALFGMSLGSSIIGNAWQGYQQSNQNSWNQTQAQQQQQWNQDMANQQQQWALQNWNMQNQYNSPQSQMARFKAAGLNPHLIYGQGNPGNAQSIQTPDVKGYSRAEANNHMRGIDIFGDFTRFQNIQAQTENLQSNSQLAQQNALLTAQKTANEAIVGKKGALDYGIAQQLKDTQIAAAKANLERTQTDVRKSNLEIEYAKKTMSPRVQMMYQQLENAQKDGTLKDMDATLKKWEIELNKMNLTKGDNVFLRLLKRAIDSPLQGLFNPTY